MRKTLNTIVLLAAAAIAFSSCNTKEIAPEVSPKGKVVYFGTEVSPLTKASLSTTDDVDFTAAWDENDPLTVMCFMEDTHMGDFTGSWNTTKNAFEVSDAEGYLNVEADFAGLYPSPDSKGDIAFPATRTQDGNAYNGAYDVMVSQKVTKTLTEGETVVLPMDRQTAIAYFHLTNTTVNEPIISAKLTVTGLKIAGGFMYDEEGGYIESVGESNNITLSFTNAPSVSDLKLWFNVIPGNYTALQLDLETANYTATIKNTKGGSYVAGELYKVVMDASSKWQAKYISLPWSIDGTEGAQGWTKAVAEGGVVTSATFTNYSDANSPCHTRVPAGGYVEFRTSEPATKVVYAFRNFNSNVSVTLEGSIDGNNYTVISTSTSGTSQVRNNFTVISGFNSDYRYYRIKNISSNNIGLGPVTISNEIIPMLSVSDVVDFPAIGGSDVLNYNVKNVSDDIAVSCDGTIVTSAVKESDGVVRYTLAPNYTTSAKEGTISLTSATYPEINTNVSVSQKRSSLYVSSLTITLPADTKTNTFTVTSPEMGWTLVPNVSDGKNFTLSTNSGSANDAAQSVTISSTTTPSSSEELTLGTISVYRNDNTSDTQKKTITVKLAMVGAASYEKATSISDGDSFLAVYNGHAVSAYASSYLSTNAVTVSNDKITKTAALEACEITVEEIATGKYALKLGSNYLGYNSSTKFKVQTTKPTSTDKAFLWTITILSDGTADIRNVNATTRFFGWYASSSQFRAYAYNNGYGDYPLPTLYK